MQLQSSVCSNFSKDDLALKRNAFTLRNIFKCSPVKRKMIIRAMGNSKSKTYFDQHCDSLFGSVFYFGLRYLVPFS